MGISPHKFTPMPGVHKGFERKSGAVTGFAKSAKPAPSRPDSAQARRYVAIDKELPESYPFGMSRKELTMASILVKNVPPNIHQAIKERAKRHFRSVNNEIIACLDNLLFPRVVDPEIQIEKVRNLRKLVKGFLTDQVVNEMINEGRK